MLHIQFPLRPPFYPSGGYYHEFHMPRENLSQPAGVKCYRSPLAMLVGLGQHSPERRIGDISFDRQDATWLKVAKEVRRGEGALKGHEGLLTGRKLVERPVFLGQIRKAARYTGERSHKVTVVLSEAEKHLFLAASRETWWSGRSRSWWNPCQRRQAYDIPGNRWLCAAASGARRRGFGSYQPCDRRW